MAETKKRTSEATRRPKLPSIVFKDAISISCAKKCHHLELCALWFELNSIAFFFPSSHPMPNSCEAASCLPVTSKERLPSGMRSLSSLISPTRMDILHFCVFLSVPKKKKQKKNRRRFGYILVNDRRLWIQVGVHSKNSAFQFEVTK